ncbi:predicted protein [Naegleria gruberi]|uniref:Predicted protein n=1 Tax=Naegleria gruberi TaxID=5762 RepID=D2V5I5_NAEGR|nr:uncharacterized protein NAEGRDRAFT_64089 [Naegleria gruberi]EFC47656.1 predicted protein [Naegleria gruberi]|eukprot:XP_002680400.1 predicted protein [Naegleria gruberi strain NEG-M]
MKKPVICVDGKDRVLNYEYLDKRKHIGMIVRNLFRKWLIEWIENSNSYWNVGKVAEKSTLIQTLDVNEGKYEELLQFSRIFGDVRKMLNVNNQNESQTSSIWNFFNQLVGYSKHNAEEVINQEEKQVDDIKIAMFGSEISQLYHHMKNSPNKHKYLVGCDLSIIEYHSLRSLTRYRYQVFANAGSDKYIGVTKSYFKGSHFIVLLFDSKSSMEYLKNLDSFITMYMELIFIQLKSSHSNHVQKHEAEQFIYSNFGEAVYLEIDIENNPKSVDAILSYTALLSDILMGCNLNGSWKYKKGQ